MTKQLLSAIATLGLVVSVSASAATKSEFFYQTDADKNQLTPVLVYNTANKTFESTGTDKTDTKATNLKVRYERGINEMLSAGALIPYVMKTDETDTGTTSKNEFKGMGDLTLFLKGNHAMAEGATLWFGADLNLSPGDQKVTVKTGKNEVNGYAGGHSLNPYVGYSMLMSSYLVGAKLSTELGIGDRTRKVDSSGTETKSKLTGGHTTALTLFGEMPITGGTAGAKLVYAGKNTTKDKDATGATTTTGGYTTIGLGVYGNYDFSETAALVAGLDYTKLAGDRAEDKKVDSTSDMSLSVGGRFTF